MMSKTVTSLAFAAGCVLAVGAMPPAHAQNYPPAPMPPYGQPQVVEHQMITNGPQASRGDNGGWSARRNNAESAQYDRLLASNPGFRAARMRKECGPITDPQLHSQCMASFGQDEPMIGSSAPPRRLRHHRDAGY